MISKTHKKFSLRLVTIVSMMAHLVIALNSLLIPNRSMSSSSTPSWLMFTAPTHLATPTKKNPAVRRAQVLKQSKTRMNQQLFQIQTWSGRRSLSWKVRNCSPNSNTCWWIRKSFRMHSLAHPLTYTSSLTAKSHRSALHLSSDHQIS